MKTLRTLVVGFMLGGAFGSKLALFIGSSMELNRPFQLMEIGLLIGSLIGVSIAILVMSSSVLPVKEAEPKMESYYKNSNLSTNRS